MGDAVKPPCDPGVMLAGSPVQAAVTGHWILAATILGSSMAFIDGTVVNVALPALQTALHANITEVQWVVESYALFLAVLGGIGLVRTGAECSAAHFCPGGFKGSAARCWFVTVSVAPLTTTVMNAVEQNYAGAASGINNAVSRIAGLLAIAVFGAVLTGVFQSTLSQRLDSLAIAHSTRAEIEAQRSKLAAATTNDPQGRQAIQDAFLAGYRRVIWMAVGLAVASSLSALVLVKGGARPDRSRYSLP